jgi:hypothetical protein
LVAAAVGVALLSAVGSTQARAGFREARARTILVDAVNTGAPLYNVGDVDGYYRVYRGALSSIRPLLQARPELGAYVTAGFRSAAQQPTLRGKAWVLRMTIDALLEELP